MLFFTQMQSRGVGHYLFDLKNLPVDFLSSASHKYHGPKGIGFSFVRKNSGLEPFIYGGAQERGLRAGTESVHNIVGMHEALDISHKKLEIEKKQILFLKNHFKKGLIEIFPNVHFNGNSSENNLSTYTLLNVALPIDEKKASLLDFHLDLKGIACSKGSACQSGSSQGSHVLNHIQNQKIKKMSSLRFSFSSFNNIDEVDYVLETLKEFVTQ